MDPIETTKRSEAKPETASRVEVVTSIPQSTENINPDTQAQLDAAKEALHREALERAYGNSSVDAGVQFDQKFSNTAETATPPQEPKLQEKKSNIWIPGSEQQTEGFKPEIKIEEKTGRSTEEILADQIRVADEAKAREEKRLEEESKQRKIEENERRDAEGRQAKIDRQIEDLQKKIEDIEKLEKGDIVPPPSSVREARQQNMSELKGKIIKLKKGEINSEAETASPENNLASETEPIASSESVKQESETKLETPIEAQKAFIEESKVFIETPEPGKAEIKKIGERYKEVIQKDLESEVREATKKRVEEKGMRVVKKEDYLNNPEIIKRTEEKITRERQLRQMKTSIEGQWQNLSEERKSKYVGGIEEYAQKAVDVSIEEWTKETENKLGIKEELMKQGVVFSTAVACELWSKGLHIWYADEKRGGFLWSKKQIVIPSNEQGGKAMTFKSKKEFVEYIKTIGDNINDSVKMEAKERMLSIVQNGQRLWKAEKNASRVEIIKEAIVEVENSLSQLTQPVKNTEKVGGNMTEGNKSSEIKEKNIVVKEMEKYYIDLIASWEAATNDPSKEKYLSLFRKYLENIQQGKFFDKIEGADDKEDSVVNSFMKERNIRKARMEQLAPLKDSSERFSYDFNKRDYDQYVKFIEYIEGLKEKEGEPTLEAPKRGRGRPKGSTKKEPVENKPKRGRGRPKGSTKKEPVENKPKRGRGRPKGSTKKEPEIASSEK